MPHAREQIRDLVVTRLTGLTTTGTNVSSSRVYAWRTLPALNVMTAEDEAISYTTTGSTLVANHDLMLTIEARAKLAADVDDQLDDICAEIETAIATDRTLGGVVKDTLLVSTSIEIDGGEEHLVGIARLNFNVEYRVSVADPTTLRG